MITSVLRHVLVAVAAAGADPLDGVDHLHALHHPPEDAVAPAVLARIVQEAVVRDVDEELGGGGVGLHGAGHGDGPGQVLEPVLGLVLDRGAGGLWG